MELHDTMPCTEPLVSLNTKSQTHIRVIDVKAHFQNLVINFEAHGANALIKWFTSFLLCYSKVSKNGLLYIPSDRLNMHEILYNRLLFFTDSYIGYQPDDFLTQMYRETSMWCQGLHKCDAVVNSHHMQCQKDQ